MFSNNKKIFLIAFLSAILILPACEKQLEEYNPSGLTAEGVYTTPAGFETLVNGAYSYARWWYGKEEGYGLSEMGTDLWLPGVDNRNPEIMLYNNLQSNQAFLESLWGQFYQAINLCNAGINGIQESGLSASLKTVREAELRFLRAFYYWHIVETWGGVHLSTEATVGPQTTANRSGVDAFYQLIFDDLNVAVANLPNTSTDYGRATKPAAEAFLARMHLTRGNYRQASDLAQKVISSYGLSLQAKYGDLWSMSNLKNKEIIWAVNYSVDLNNNDLANATTYPGGHTRGGHNGHLMFPMTYERNGTNGMARDIANGRPFARYMPTRFLVQLFDETRDARYDGSFQTVWLCNKAGSYKKKVGATEVSYTLALGDTALLTTKNDVPDAVDLTKKYQIYDISNMYKTDGKIGNNAQYITLKKFMDPTRTSINEQQSARDAFVIRLAEMYLIAAEAELLLNNPAKAAEMINFVRRRAALPGKTLEMEVAAANLSLDYILDERAREFAGEQLRWFDLKRTGKLVERVRKYNPEAAGLIQDFHVLRPIPQRQLDAVLNKDEFKQNPGYN
ncbi:MAG: RagB/SusD family nutrient uptake outer membrane protein [Haliscomenobacter sp.]|nr:RagB/SusD family nutrient uptake outer membrane protein [Haliscomenobacter sp.]